jgi:hypothetical protein
MNNSLIVKMALALKSFNLLLVVLNLIRQWIFSGDGKRLAVEKKRSLWAHRNTSSFEQFTRSSLTL